MNTSAPTARLNPFSFPSDTTLRFILLILCALGATLWIYDTAPWQTRGEIIATIKTRDTCDQQSGLREAMQQSLTRVTNVQNETQIAESSSQLETASTIHTRCLGALAQKETKRMLIGITLLLIIATGIYLLFPFWIRWRKRLILLSAQDLPSEVMADLRALCQQAGLRKHPQFLWNPLDPRIDGQAFGCMGNYTVALTGGLVLQAYQDVPTFHAVMRHEFAHLRNRDIDKTYFSVAIWLAFVITALVPFVLACVMIPMELTFTLDLAARILALFVLVWLMRNGILQVRELYADVRAQTWDGEASALWHVLQDLPQRPAGLGSVLVRILQRFPQRWQAYGDKIAWITQTHPNPRIRRAMLEENWRLLQIGFWDAFSAGVVAVLVFDGLNRFLASFSVSLSFSNASVVSVLLTGLVFGGLASAIVGTGLWRARCACLLLATPKGGIGQIALGMTCGLLLGQNLSFSLNASALDFSLVLKFLPLYILYISLVFLILWLLFLWIVTAATTWLRVTTSTSMLQRSAFFGLCIAGCVWAFCFGPLFFLTDTFLSLWLHPSADVALPFPSWANSHPIGLFVLLLGLVAVFLAPLYAIGLFALWAFPFAARFWQRQALVHPPSGWAWLSAAKRQRGLSDAEPVRFRLVFLVAIAGSLLFCVLLVDQLLWERLITSQALRSTTQFKISLAYWDFSRAALIQAGMAIALAAWARSNAVLLGLLAVWITGCIMLLGFLGLNIPLGGSLTAVSLPVLLSLLVVPGSLLAVLFAPLTALLTKRIGPALRTAFVGVLIYCLLILCISAAWRFLTHQSVTSNLLGTTEIVMLVVFEAVVAALVAVRREQRGWLHGWLTALLMGWGACVSRLLASESVRSSLAQDMVIIRESILAALWGLLLAALVIPIVFFARDRMRHSP